MAHEILAVKLCQLEDQLTRLSSRIHLSETAGRKQLRQEIRALSQECRETELALRSQLQRSRAEAAATLADTYGEIEAALGRARTKLDQQAAGRYEDDAASEEKILVAEYALDFAVQAANRALLLALEAIDAQWADQERERRPFG